MFVGLQASGKTTFYQERFANTHAHVSKDRFPHNRNKERRQLQLVRDAFATGRSVVVDNTNITRESRAPLLAVAQEAGAVPVAYHFVSGVRDALRRNALRSGRRRVPDVAIFSSVKRLEPPEAVEGFGAIVTVELTDMGFRVMPAQDG